MRPAVVQPGAVARVSVSYLQDALVKVIVYFPRQRPFWLYDTTNRHGHATLAIRVPRNVPLDHGRALASIFVRAMVGPWRNLARLAPVVHPGATARITVSSTPLTLVRALVTLPGMPPLRFFDATDGHGHLRLSIPVPRHLHGNRGPTVAQVAVAALAPRRTAVAASPLPISDMLVSVAGTPIVDCMQTQTVHVAYRPNTRVRIRLLFPHQHQVTFTARTNRKGTAAVNVQLGYHKAPSPLRIGVEVSAASGRSPRMERIALAVRLPRACRA